MPNRKQRKQIATATLEVIETGILEDSIQLDISDLIAENVNGTRSYSESAALPRTLPKENGIQTRFLVRNTTTLDTAHSLHMENFSDKDKSHSCGPTPDIGDREDGQEEDSNT